MKKTFLLSIALIAAIASNGQTSVDPGATAGSTGTVSFTYNGTAVTLTTVRSSDGNVWLQQNLGSSQVATSGTDALSYGHYFQFGRWDDGHQLSTSTAAASSTLTANNPSGLGTGNTSFITGFWSGGATTDTWSANTTASATAGKDPCTALGSGWHLPTSAEFATLYTAEGITSAATAFSSNLKFSIAGYRTSTVSGAGSLGVLWTASPTTTGSNGLGATFAGGPVTSGYTFSRSNGLPCRCMKVAPATIGCSGTPTAPTISSLPSTICANSTVSLTGNNTNTATGITLQWQQSATGLAGSWSNVTTGTGGTTLNYTSGPLTANTYFQLVATCTTSSSTAASTSVLITVTPTVTPAITIVSDAAGDSSCNGSLVTFTATGTNGGASPSYQWFKGTVNVGINSTTYSDNTLTSSDAISCVITSNATCLTAATATSNVITTTISNNVTPNIAITADPVTAVCAGSSVTLTATQINGGDTPVYQWFVGNNAVGQNTTYTYQPSNGDVVSCVLTSNALCASVATDTSNLLTLITNPLPPQPTIAANGNVLTSSATSGNQWYKNNAIISGATNQTYTVTASGYYQVMVTDGNTCSSISDSLLNEITPTGVNTVNQQNTIRVYPMPFGDYLTIELTMDQNKAIDGSIVVMNQLGQKVYTDTLRSTKKNLSLSMLSSGMYFLSIDIDGQKYTYKIVRK